MAKISKLIARSSGAVGPLAVDVSDWARSSALVRHPTFRWETAGKTEEKDEGMGREIAACPRS